ncbi:MAG: fimbrillin family protein [Bacteroidales bacterium]|nr:fimbrillin family protein [Bacteroidales bacterium]
MLKRIIRIMATAVGCALLLAGCSLGLDPAGEAISFQAGSKLLSDDAKQTTKGDILDGEIFATGSTFCVFGSYYSGETENEIFDGTVVTKQAGGAWTYDNPKLWIWNSTGDHYDFVAVSPSGIDSERMNVAGNIAVSTAYDIGEDDYDLLATTYRRRGNVINPKDIVDMRFTHMVNAVGVVVINNSETKAVTIDAVKFKNLTVCGDAKVTLDAAGNTNLSWINTERNSSETRIKLPDEDLDPGQRYETGYEPMIPQRLDQAVGASPVEENMPRLLITFTPDGLAQTTAEITLKNIERSDGTPITTWEMGVKYTYYISMRLDGGVLVSIETTAWDPVEAETPGLLI